VGKNPKNAGRSAERLHHRSGLVRGDNQVYVPDRLSHPAQRPSVCGPPHERELGEFAKQLLGQVQSYVEVNAPAAGLGVVDRERQVLLAALSPAAQIPQPLIVQCIQ